MKYLIPILVIIISFKILELIENLKEKHKIKKAGKEGEKFVGNVLTKIKKKDDHILSNIEISYKNKKAEFDKIVINRNGIFIIEVKNYVGKIRGKEKDSYWIKVKDNDFHGMNKKRINNPLNQLNREIWMLTNYMHHKNISVHVEGYVYMVNANRPFLHKKLLNHPKELDEVIHQINKTKLSEDKIKQIIQTLK